MQVLIVDDDDFALSVLEDTMQRMGYSVVCAHDGSEALDILRLGEIRLIITDWDMPAMNGLELCRAIRREDLAGYVYVIMLTGREGAKQRMDGLCSGADDFLNKPLDREELLVCLKTAERILSLETRDLALFALAKLAESRDSEAGAHVERVQGYSRVIAKNLSAEVKKHYGVDDEFIRLLFQTSPLHDLGKVGIPDAVLLKPGMLTPEEFAIMKTHAIVGAKTLDSALERFPSSRFLQMARDIAATHHEKFDGTGYPQGLSGEQIPLPGRIVAVADVYDALTNRRVYKNAMPHAEAMAIMRERRGTHFDPEVIDAFVRAEQLIVGVWDRLRDTVPQSPEQPEIIPKAFVGLADPTPCKILVVDDDPVILAKLTQLLAATGESIFPANNGEEALSIWRAHTPRVVVSDWVMPQRDGVDLCRQIRAHGADGPAHFIMLTGHSDKSRLLDAYQAGVDDFISKPFLPEELLAKVRAGIRTAKLYDEVVCKARGSQALNAQLTSVNSRLEKLSITDDLTGLFNRRHAMYKLEEQWGLSERYGRPLSVALLDIDHFKRVNDTHGHDAGDSILRQVAAILREHTRGTDSVCRVGGEEFLIVFPLQTMAEACICAARCRAAVEAHTFTTNNIRVKATISAGLAERAAGMTQFAELLRVADLALYEAKRTGRNKLITSDQIQPGPGEIAKTAPTLPGADPVNRPPVDINALLTRCGGDANFANALMERFRLQAGSEVGLIEEGLAKGDNTTLTRAAHNIKSMSAYLSADRASELAKRIEELGHKSALSELGPAVVQLRHEIDNANRLAQPARRQEARSLPMGLIPLLMPPLGLLVHRSIGKRPQRPNRPAINTHRRR